MQPQISVLIPVYNAEQYLFRCLKSLSAQIYTDFEILCIDDGSKDNSFKILTEYAKKEPRLRILQQKNSGVSAARNHLMIQARGTYIAFVDADDWVEKNYLQTLYETAQRTGADITRCFFKQFNQQQMRFEKPDCSHIFYKPIKDTPPGRLVAGHYDSVVWGKLYLRSWVEQEKLRFALRVSAAEDLSFSSLAFVLAGKVATVSEALYCYCKGIQNSITYDSERSNCGILENRIFLSDELSNRGYYIPPLVDRQLRFLIWDICRLRKLSANKQKEHDLLLGKGLAYLRRDKEFCSFYGRWRVNLFLWICGQPGSKWFYFWAKVFR